ncbi:hypothetical protein JCM5353_002637 [Sporobolomyces roseus]
MSSTSRKARKGSINYREVDSDEDIELEDQSESGGIKSMGSLGVIKKTVGDTYGSKQATKRSKKRSRKSKKAIEEEDRGGSMYDSKLLLKMPFDIFAETCSHLEGTDLINLAQVNKSFRQTLLSKAARSIWAYRRKSDGYPLPEDTTELELATLVYGLHCQSCGSEKNVTCSFALRSRYCKKCSKTLFIVSRKLPKGWPTLHPEAKKCVRFKLRREYDDPRNSFYVAADLAEADEELKDLEEEDEAALAQLESLKAKSSTRSRPKSTGTLPTADAVARYVEERSAWVQQESKQQRYWNVVAMKSLCKHSKALKAIGIWSQDEIRHYKKPHSGFDLDANAISIPRHSPQIDPEAWKVFRIVIQTSLAKEAKHKADRKEGNARHNRLCSMSDYYDEVMKGYDKDDLVRPSSWDFDNLPSILPLWKPVGADPSREAFEETFDTLQEDLLNFKQTARLKAIRTIIAANTDVQISSLSLNSSDYPESSYNSEFFSLATSTFLDYTYVNFRYDYEARPYPQILEDSSRPGRDSRGLSAVSTYSMNIRQISAVRCMLELADLDPLVATWSDLVAVGRRFLWKNDPSISKRQVTYDCLGLLTIVRKRGPSNARIRAGDGVILEYLLEVDEGENSEGLDEDSDEESRDAQDDDDEVEEEDEQSEEDEGDPISEEDEGEQESDEDA